MFHYNFIRIHQTIRCTPAMAAGVTDHLWTMADVVELIESRECEAAQITALIRLSKVHTMSRNNVVTFAEYTWANLEGTRRMAGSARRKAEQDGEPRLPG